MWLGSQDPKRMWHREPGEVPGASLSGTAPWPTSSMQTLHFPRAPSAWAHRGQWIHGVSTLGSGHLPSLTLEHAPWGSWTSSFGENLRFKPKDVLYSKPVGPGGHLCHPLDRFVLEVPGSVADIGAFPHQRTPKPNIVRHLLEPNSFSCGNRRPATLWELQADASLKEF